MKKFLLVLTLVLALCTLFVAVAEDTGDDHAIDGIEYDDVAQVHELDGHDVTFDKIMKEPTCTAKGIARYTCEEDDTHFHEAFIKPLGHDWSEWKVTKVATCEEEGSRERTCSRCGKKETEVIKTAHVWSSDLDDTNWGKVTKNPTCTEAGEAVDYCTLCGKIREFVDPRFIDPIDHEYVPVIDVEPNCRHEGKGHFACWMCGKVLTAKVADELGLSFDGAKVTLSDGTEVEIEVKTEGNELSFTLAINPDGHDWDNWVREGNATCYVPNSEVRWCKICGAKQELVLDTLEKLEERGYDTDLYMDDGRLAPVYVRTARLLDCYTIEAKYYCVNCYKVDEDGNEEYADGHDPFDTQETVTAHVYMHSNTLYKDEASAKKAEKTFAEFVAPTCDEDGYIAYKCIYDDTLDPKVAIEADINLSAHDESTYDKVIIPALGHDWSDWEVRYAPGEGDNEYGYWLRECERCGLTDERISKQQPKELCFGKHDFMAVETKDATCTEDGYVKYVCSRCGTEPDEQEILPKLGHDYVKEVVTEPTCKDAGKALFTCSRCGDYYTEELPTIEHTPMTLEGKDATCLEDGLTEGEACSVCGTVLKAQTVIKAVGSHDYQKVEAVEATCTTAGSTEGVVCTRCGDAMIAPAEVPALGHKEVVAEGKAPTCTEKGLTEGKTCERCGEVIAEQTEIDALGHDWDDGVITKEATPTENGVKTYTCARCGETKEESFEFEATEDTKYAVTEAGFDKDDMVLSGVAEHDPVTKPADKAVYARVTFFYTDGTYTVVLAAVAEDGSFETMTSGEVEHISVLIIDNPKIRPTDYNKLGDSYGFDVK